MMIEDIARGIRWDMTRFLSVHGHNKKWQAEGIYQNSNHYYQSQLFKVAYQLRDQKYLFAEAVL